MWPQTTLAAIREALGRTAARDAERSADGRSRRWRATPSPGSSPPQARATSGSSPAAHFRRRSLPSGSLRRGIRTPACYVMSPAASVVEEVAARLAARAARTARAASVGFVTGCHMANFTALAAARHELLRRAGWDVEARRPAGRAARCAWSSATKSHVTVRRRAAAARHRSRQLVRVAADDQGRMKPDALAAALESATDPTIVCAQAGNVNTGAFDPLDAIADARRARTARGCTSTARSACGRRRAPRCASRARRRARRLVGDRRAQVAERALRLRPGLRRAPGGASRGDEHERGLPRCDRRTSRASRWTGRRSRRGARAASPSTPRCASLGRRGVEELVERCCRLARRFADRLRSEPAIQILNESC